MRTSDRWLLASPLLALLFAGINQCSGAEKGFGCNVNNDCQGQCGQGSVCHDTCFQGGKCGPGESCSSSVFPGSCSCTPAAAPGCPDGCPKGEFCHPDYQFCVAPVAAFGSAVASGSLCPYGGPTDAHGPQCFDANWSACRPLGDCTPVGAFLGVGCEGADGGVVDGGTAGCGSTTGSSGTGSSGGTSSTGSSSGGVSSTSSSTGGSSTGSSSTGGSSTSGGSTGGSSTGGSSTGGCAVTPPASQASSPVTGAGSCNAAAQPTAGLPLSDLYSAATSGNSGNEFSTCTTNVDCDCPLACVQDHTLGRLGIAPNDFCERPCTTTSDCDRIDTICLGGFCTPNSCDLPGSFQVGGPCNVQGCGDGTCAYEALGTSGYVGWICLAAGTASGACDPGQVAPQPAASVCGPGTFCSPAADGGGVCEPYCTASDGGCPAGQACSIYPGTANENGICATCLPSYSRCSTGSPTNACCSGVCTASGVCQ